MLTRKLTRKPPRRGYRSGNWPLRGGRRYTDPPRRGNWVAVLPQESLTGGLRADNPKRTGKPDDNRINVNQDHEVRYWAKELGVSPNELRQAVATAGPMVKDVREHLNR